MYQTQKRRKHGGAGGDKLQLIPASTEKLVTSDYDVINPLTNFPMLSMHKRSHLVENWMVVIRRSHSSIKN